MKIKENQRFLNTQSKIYKKHKKDLKTYLRYGNIYFALRNHANRGVAQLVEYVVWDHGAGGSSPLTPTIFYPKSGRTY